MSFEKIRNCLYLLVGVPLLFFFLLKLYGLLLVSVQTEI